MNILSAVVVLGVLATAHGINSYLVLVPRNIKPGTTLKIPVHFMVPPTMETLTAILVDRENITLSTVSKTNLVKKDDVLELPIPQTISWGSYRVNVTGYGAVNFHNSTTVYGAPRSQVIFVQTDKAMYKPGETVQYRVFAINASLQLTPSILDLEFYDPKGNKIAEAMGEDNLQPGGISGELPLSDMPPLGSWRISAQVKGAENTKENYNFKVEEYVLPKFEITVSLPSFGRESDTSLVGSVKAMYTFGKPVKGLLVLTVKKRYGSGFHDPRAIRTELQIDGEASFEIPMNVLERLTRNLEYETLLVHANVTEAITGITLDGEGDIRYHRNPYKIEFYPNMPDNFKPGFGPYPVLLKLTQQDGRPPASVGQTVDVTVTYFTDKNGTTLPPDSITLPNYEVVSPFIDGDTILIETKTHQVNVDGTVQFDLTIPDNTATFTIKAVYGTLDTFKEVKRFRSPGEAYIKAELQSTNPLKIGDIATVTLTSNVAPPSVYYAILSKGSLVESGALSTFGTLTFPVTREMTPSAKLVVYFVQPDGEILADGLNFVVDDIFENKVTIQFDQTNVQPKTPVDLVVTADEGSLVNILTVDKSVLLLADGNDITPTRVQTELSRLGDTPWIVRGWGRVLPWSFGADDVSDIFDNAQLRVLTDANLYEFNLWNLQRKLGGRGGAGGGMRMMAFSAGAEMNDAAPASAAQGQIRKDFPETWMWKSAVASPLREARFPDIAPDTITDFVANAFAIHPETGLGVAPVTSNLTVFLPFFVNLQLPYAVVRGETAVIQANVFNYRNSNRHVIVRLKASPDYDIISIASDGTETVVTGDSQQCIMAKKGTPTPAYFNIRPTTIGAASINMRATVPDPVNIFDEVIRTIPVKAEGIEKEKNMPVLVSMQTPGTKQEVRDIAYPTIGLVQGSEKIRVTVIGDLFGPSLENLGRLIRLPYGCGEQNMLNFAPSVFAAVYMKMTGRFDTDLVLQEKIKNTLRTGLQRQLVYQRNDGSFSAFGNADDEGSTWLTAFVMKSFSQAKKLNIIYVDPNVIEKAVKYIIRHQNKIDRSFENTGIVSHKAMQGGSAQTKRSLTAYVLIALQQVKQAEIIVDMDTSRSLNDAIAFATSYLTGEIPQMTSVYEMAITVYALQYGNPNCHRCTALLNKLESHTSKVVEGNSKYWRDNSNALTIEQTSYILMTYTLREDPDNGLLILNWLVRQRNTRGGFSSTQDTVIALQALSEFATLIYSKDVNLAVDITTKTNGVANTPFTVLLTSSNHDILQYVDFDGSVDQIVIDATGVGLALIDINQYYNIKQEEVPPSYVVQVETLDETATSYNVRVCAMFNIPASRSNMAIMDIGVVSGFEPQKDKVVKSGIMKRIEMASGRLIIYFDEIPTTETCVSVPVQRVSIVAGVKPATVVVYSYYEPTERTMVEYLPSNLQTATVCDTCPICCDASKSLNLMQCGIY